MCAPIYEIPSNINTMYLLGVRSLQADQLDWENDMTGGASRGVQRVGGHELEG